MFNASTYLAITRELARPGLSIGMWVGLFPTGMTTQVAGRNWYSVARQVDSISEIGDSSSEETFSLPSPLSRSVRHRIRVPCFGHGDPVTFAMGS